MRYISNRSTGRLGTAIARAALARGAMVTFLYGTGSRTPAGPGDAPIDRDAASRLTCLEVETVDDLLRLVRQELRSRTYDAVIHAMAVLDFAPDRVIEEKTSSEGREEWTIRLVRTPKVIAEMKDLDPGVFLVGFKLEAGKSPAELAAIARERAARYRTDLFVANDLTEVGPQRHQAYIVERDGTVIASPSGKEEIAATLIDVLCERLAGRPGRDQSEGLVSSARRQLSKGAPRPGE